MQALCFKVCCLSHVIETNGHTFPTKANQVVPDWLEDVAETALGTGYGPKGGRYGGKDTRKVFLLKTELHLMWC